MGDVTGAGLESRILGVLLGPLREPPRDRRLWTFATLIGFFGPGSVPAAVVLTVVHARFLDHNYSAGPLAVGYALAQCGVPIVLAAYRPVLAWAIQFAALPVVALAALPNAGNEPFPYAPTAMLTFWIVQYAVALYSGRPVWLATWAAFCGVVIGLGLANPQYGTLLFVPIVVLTAVCSFAAGLVGDALRSRWLAQQQVVAEERRTAEERARRQLLEQRAVIARELHDIVAHHTSVIAVQSQTARYRLDGMTDPVRREFEEIGESARASLAEMRRMLAVLRGDHEELPRIPQPGLGGLEPLVTTTRRAGTPVTLSVRVPPDLPDSLALTVYRIVQEALSNVVRHALGAPASVEVAADGAALRIRVVNEVPPRSAPMVEHERSGQGLVGMRERVAVVGGRLTVGPGSGGFVVEAILPLAREEGEST